ncbi:MAG: hypothetical protein V1934_08635 [Methanobacteriota archaeon]
MTHAKTIGIMTSDFRLFYDLAEALKSMGLQFTSLTFDGRVPQHVGVVLTSERELADVFFEPKVAVAGNVKSGIRKGLTFIAGKGQVELLFIGVDPGEMPGIAVVLKGRVLETQRAMSPEDAADRVLEIRDDYAARRTVVRIGHGDADNRDRILRRICGTAERCEIVDESTTSSPSTTDMDSAIDIARTAGYPVTMPRKVAPKPGKVRDLQRKSRIESAGSLTLSKAEAEAVADGRMTMAEALRNRRRQKQVRSHVRLI